MKQKIYCDYCKYEFAIEKISERNWIENGENLREIWFNCPKCNARFEIYKGRVKGGVLIDRRTNKRL